MLRFWLVCCLCTSSMTAARCLAQEADGEERPCDLPPFDQVVLDAANENAVLQVELLDFPERRVPAQPLGDLNIRLIADPTRAFDVSWQNIKQVILFEEFLLSEASRLSAAGDFDEAFDYYARLLRDYPELPGLNDAVNAYLKRNALALVESQNYDRALAVLSTLYERAPNTAGIRQLVDTVCSKMIQEQLRAKNYASARAVLQVWQDQFRGLNSPAVAAWEQRFTAAAERQIAEARQQSDAKDYLAAGKSITLARDIWPDIHEADKLLAQVQAQYPAVTVGVFEASPSKPDRRIDDWASLRTSELREPMLAKLIGLGTEGGIYQSSFGGWQSNAAGTRMTLKMSRDSRSAAGSSPSATEIARCLLNMADRHRPEFNPDFAAAVAAISVDGPDTVHIDWKHPGVRPEAWLQQPLTESAATWANSRWRVADDTSKTRIFEANGTQSAGAPWLRSIVEQTLADDRSAVEALVRGEIDVLDRVPPWQLARLQSVNGVRVVRYAAPTVHALLLNPESELLQLREFRRAISFAIPRERILKQVLLGGGDAPGFTAVTGPFPAGMSLDDPIRYAYNNHIEPRPFEPRLGAVLASVAWAKILNPSGKDEEAAEREPQPIPTLVLAHPADPVARLASESIQIQLTRAGIPIKLAEFTADELVAGKVDYDLRYAELAVWEPVADARALLGPTGLAGALCSAYLESTLNSLANVTNWKDARAHLAEIHDIVHHDLPLIPLWQTVNFFAYRDNLLHVGAAPVTLYQNVDQWRLGVEQTVAGGAE